MSKKNKKPKTQRVTLAFGESGPLSSALIERFEHMLIHIYEDEEGCFIAKVFDGDETSFEDAVEEARNGV